MQLASECHHPEMEAQTSLDGRAKRVGVRVPAGFLWAFSKCAQSLKFEFRTVLQVRYVYLFLAMFSVVCLVGLSSVFL